MARLLTKVAKSLTKKLQDIPDQDEDDKGSLRSSVNLTLDFSDEEDDSTELVDSRDIFLDFQRVLEDKGIWSQNEDVEEIQHFFQQEKELLDKQAEIDRNKREMRKKEKEIEQLKRKNLELEQGLQTTHTAHSLGCYGHHTASHEKKNCSAVVFDCGTGETKCLLYQYDQEQEDCPVSLKQVEKSDAVIDLIEGDNTNVETIVKKLGEVYTKGVEENGGKQVDYCIVGASSWARKVYAKDVINRKKDELVNKLVDEGLFPKILNKKEECNFELVATQYAFTMVQKKNIIDEKKNIAGVLGSGGGSCQFSYLRKDVDGGGGDVMDSILPDIGSRKGIKEFLKEVEEGKLDTEPFSAVDKWIDDCKEVLENKLELKGYKPITGSVVCISGQWYAADGLSHYKNTVDDVQFCNKDGDANFVSKKAMVALAEEYAETRQNEWTNMTPEEKDAFIGNKKELKAWVRNFCNVKVSCLFWKCFFDDDGTELCFKRNWEIAEGVKFRNTWTAGWFLNLLRLQEHELFEDFKDLNLVFNMIQDEAKERNIISRFFGYKYPKAVQHLNDMSRSHLSYLDEMAEILVALAKNKAEEVDEWLKTIKEECESQPSTTTVELIGFEKNVPNKDYPEGVRFKSKQSIERKLMAKLAVLLKTNNESNKDGGHDGGRLVRSPTEAELMNEIRDVLRYTIVTSADGYFQTVKHVNRYLVEKGCRVTAKNYWNKEKGQTAYMGINMRFFLPEDAVTLDVGYTDGQYPVELQIHTEQSRDTKEVESHEIYEEMRVENVKSRKKELFEKQIKVWDKVDVPKIVNEDGTEESVADYVGFFHESKSHFKHKVSDWKAVAQE